MRGFPDDSECLLRKTVNQQVAIGKTHSLCGGGALRKCPEKLCRRASGVLLAKRGTFLYAVSRRALAHKLACRERMRATE